MYLKDFKRKNDVDIKIFEGPRIMSCVGPDKDRSHMCLYYEGAMNCHECKQTVCNTCVRRVDDLICYLEWCISVSLIGLNSDGLVRTIE